jgi:hypothetical protein
MLTVIAASSMRYQSFIQLVIDIFEVDESVIVGGCRKRAVSSENGNFRVVEHQGV